MKKFGFILFILVLFVLLMYHILWFANLNSYRKYEKRVGCSEKYNSYTIEEDGYVYSVFRPDYPDLTGNLSVSKQMVYGTEKEYDNISMIIWPNYKGGFTVGIMISHEVLVTSDTSVEIVTDKSVNLEFDEKGRLLPECEQYKEDYLANLEAIEELYERAEKMWNIKLPR